MVKKSAGEGVYNVPGGQIELNLYPDIFEKRLRVTTKWSIFIFNKNFYKELDFVVRGSHLGPDLPKSFLCYHE